MKMLSEVNNWDDLSMFALNGMGLIYMQILDYEKAMEYFLSSYEITLKIEDKKRELTVLNNIAVLFFEKNPSKAKEYLTKGYALSTEIQDTFNMVLFATNLAILLNNMREIDTASKYINSGFNMLSNSQNEELLINIYIAKMQNLLLREECDEAEQLGLYIIKRFPKSNRKKREVLILISDIYAKKGNIDNALDFSLKALDKESSLYEKKDIYRQLSNYYELKNNLNLSLRYKDSLILVMDSLKTIDNKTNIENNQIRLELLNFEKELAENKAKQKTERILFTSIMIGVVILAIIFI
jgi:tetratricopeptide (TPR) repeat protein